MTRGTAASYWADTALAHFATMTSSWRPGEPERQAPVRRYRLPPLTPSSGIIEAIAACAPSKQGSSFSEEKEAKRLLKVKEIS